MRTTTSARPSWLWQPGRTYVELRRVANQAITTGTPTAVSWDTEDADDDGFIAAPATTLTVPTGLEGLYVVCVVGTFGASFTGRAVVDIVAAGLTFRQPATYTTERFHGQAAFARLAAADTIVVNVFHTLGSNNNWTGSLYVAKVSA